MKQYRNKKNKTIYKILGIWNDTYNLILSMCVVDNIWILFKAM